jgi:hypothetical protein
MHVCLRVGRLVATTCGASTGVHSTEAPSSGCSSKRHLLCVGDWCQHEVYTHAMYECVVRVAAEGCTACTFNISQVGQ